MNQRINELRLQRGRLLERIATQRTTLRRGIQPIAASLATADRTLSRLRAGSDYVRQHPSVTALALTVLVATRPGRAWRWAKRGFVVWQTWRTVRGRFFVFADRFGA